jgi:hypothetical protein
MTSHMTTKDLIPQDNLAGAKDKKITKILLLQQKIEQ